MSFLKPLRKRHPPVPFSPWLPLGLLVPALVALGVWAFLPEVVIATGVLEPAEFVVLKAPKSGFLEETRLEGLETLKEGTVLFRVVDREARAQLLATERELSNARSQLRRVSSELKRRRDRVLAFHDVYHQREERARSLVLAGLKSPADLEELRLGFTREMEQDRRQILELEKEEDSLSAALAILERRSEDLQKDLAQLEYRAPWAGKVLPALPLHPGKPFLGTSPREGDYVEAGKLLGFLGRTGTLAVRLNLSDVYRDRIRIGQRVTWSPVGYPRSRWIEFTGTLERLDPSPEPGVFWGWVRPDAEREHAFLRRAGVTPEDLWGQGVSARLDVPARPLWDRLGGP